MADELKIQVALTEELNKTKEVHQSLLNSPNYIQEKQTQVTYRQSRVEELLNKDKLSLDDLKTIRKYYKEITDILTASDYLKKLVNVRFSSFKVTRSITNLVKQCDEEIKLYMTEMQKLINIYAEKGEDGNPIVLENGNIKLIDQEAKDNFDKDYKDLSETDVSDNVHKVNLSESDFRDPADLPTPAEMMALEGVINWVD